MPIKRAEEPIERADPNAPSGEESSGGTFDERFGERLDERFMSASMDTSGSGRTRRASPRLTKRTSRYKVSTTYTVRGEPTNIPIPVQRRKNLNVRLTEEEHAAMVAAANAEGLSVSAWARRVLELHAGRPAVWTKEDRDYLMMAADQFRRVGINANQLVRAVNRGVITDTGELRPAIEQLGRMVEAMRLVCGRLANGGAVQGFGRPRGPGTDAPAQGGPQAPAPGTPTSEAPTSEAPTSETPTPGRDG